MVPTVSVVPMVSVVPVVVYGAYGVCGAYSVYGVCSALVPYDVGGALWCLWWSMVPIMSMMPMDTMRLYRISSNIPRPRIERALK